MYLSLSPYPPPPPLLPSYGTRPQNYAHNITRKESEDKSPFITALDPRWGNRYIRPNRSAIQPM